MNVLKEKAVWQSGLKKPDKSGVYMTRSSEGSHQRYYDSHLDCWEDGSVSPRSDFNWLNVRIWK